MLKPNAVGTVNGRSHRILCFFARSHFFFPSCAFACVCAANTVYYFADRDEKRAAEIKALLPDGARAEFTANITIGGVSAYDAEKDIFLDDTLDTRLEEQRAWFASSSGLTIE